MIHGNSGPPNVAHKDANLLEVLSEISFQQHESMHLANCYLYHDRQRASEGKEKWPATQITPYKQREKMKPRQ